MSLPRVGLITFPGMLPFMFSIPYSVFSLGMPDRLFEVNILSLDGAEVCLDGVINVSPTRELDAATDMDVLVIPGWGNLQQPPSTEFKAALREAASAGVLIVGLCYGTYPLAYAGLLEGRQATTHWLAENDFKARFPAVRLNENSLYVEDGNIITSAGSAAAIDCCIYVINRLYGYAVANAAARMMVAAPYRDGGQAQYMDLPVREATDQGINLVTEFLVANIKGDFTLRELADKFSMSRRTLIRHFEKATGLSIKKWVTRMRLKKACELLESTRWSIERVAEVSGFGSAGLLRHHFHKKFHVSPQSWRERFFNKETAGRAMPYGG